MLPVKAPPARGERGAGGGPHTPLNRAPLISRRLRLASGRRSDSLGLEPETDGPVSYIGKTPAQLLLNTGPAAVPPVRPRQQECFKSLRAAGRIHAPLRSGFAARRRTLRALAVGLRDQRERGLQACCQSPTREPGGGEGESLREGNRVSGGSPLSINARPARRSAVGDSITLPRAGGLSGFLRPPACSVRFSSAIIDLRARRYLERRIRRQLHRRRVRLFG